MINLALLLFANCFILLIFFNKNLYNIYLFNHLTIFLRNEYVTGDY